MIWFTLGNISVVGTYYTHGLNLTPRGLLAAAAAAAAAGAAVAAVPYRIASPAGLATLSATLPPYIFPVLYLISALQLPALQLAAYPRGQLAASPSFTACSFPPAGAAVSSSRCYSLRIFSGYRYETVTIICSL